MVKPAKDEAELIEQMAARRQRGCQTICPHSNQYCPCREPSVNAIAAIRAAGWAVVPVEPTFNMKSEGSVAMVKLGYLPSPGEVAEIYCAMIEASPGVKP
jgi:hypothetical protein